MKNIILVGAGSSAGYGLPIWIKIPDLLKEESKERIGRFYRELKDIDLIGPNNERFEREKSDHQLLDNFLEKLTTTYIDKTIDEALYLHLLDINNAANKGRLEEIFWVIFKNILFPQEQQDEVVDVSDSGWKTTNRYYTESDLIKRLQLMINEEDNDLHLHHALKYDAMNFLKESVIVDYNYDHIFKELTNTLHSKNWQKFHKNQVKQVCQEQEIRKEPPNSIEATKSIAFQYYFQPHGHFDFDKAFANSMRPNKSDTTFPSVVKGEGAKRRIDDVKDCLKNHPNPTNLIIFGLGLIALENTKSTEIIPNSVDTIYFTCYEEKEIGKMNEFLQQLNPTRKLTLHSVKTCSDLWDKLADKGLISSIK